MDIFDVFVLTVPSGTLEVQVITSRKSGRLLIDAATQSWS